MSPAPVCDRVAAGSDPVQTGLSPIRGRSENTFHVLHLPQHRTPGPMPRTRAPNLLDLSRGKQLSSHRGDCAATIRDVMDDDRELDGKAQKHTLEKGWFPTARKMTKLHIGDQNDFKMQRRFIATNWSPPAKGFGSEN